VTDSCHPASLRRFPAFEIVFRGVDLEDALELAIAAKSDSTMTRHATWCPTYPPPELCRSFLCKPSVRAGLIRDWERANFSSSPSRRDRIDTGMGANPSRGGTLLDLSRLNGSETRAPPNESDTPCREMTPQQTRTLKHRCPPTTPANRAPIRPKDRTIRPRRPRTARRGNPAAQGRVGACAGGGHDPLHGAPGRPERRRLPAAG